MTHRDILGEAAEEIMVAIAERFGLKLDSPIIITQSKVFKADKVKCICGKEVYAHGLCKAHYMSGEF